MAKAEQMPNMLAGSVWGKLFKRKLFKNTLFPFKLHFCEDANVLWRVELLANKISFENIISYTYRTKRPYSITSKMSKQAKKFEAINIQERIAVTALVKEHSSYLKQEFKEFQSKRDLECIINKYK